jgi:hypothetical protein
MFVQLHLPGFSRTALLLSGLSAMLLAVAASGAAATI